MQCFRCARSSASPLPSSAETVTRGGPVRVSATGRPTARSHLLKTSVTGTSFGQARLLLAEGGRARVGHGIDDEQHPVGARHLRLRAADALLLDQVADRCAQPGGVEHVQRHAVDLDALAHACRAWCPGSG